MTRVIPGLVLLSPFIVDILVTNTNPGNNLDTELLALALLALIFGEAIERIRSALFRVPRPFREYLYSVTGDETYFHPCNVKIRKLKRIWLGESQDPTSHWIGIRLDFDMKANMDDLFDLNPETVTAQDYFDFLILHINNGKSVQELRNVYVFDRNVRIATVIVFFFYLYLGSINPNNRGIYVIAFVTLFSFVFFIGSLLTGTSEDYIEMLAKEFYYESLDIE